MFAANLIGYLMGFLFTIFITRRLSEEEFGIWALVGSYITYSLMPFDLVGSWISRDAARGKKILSSAAALFALLTPISLIIYFSMALGSASVINYDPWTMALGVMILIPYILLNLGTAIQSGYAPQNLGVARIFFEISKVIIAFYLVVILRMGLIGAFVSLSIAYLIQATLLLQKSTQLFQNRVSRRLVTKWLKGAPINIIQIADRILNVTDIILMSVITGQAIIAGYWQAAVTASALVASSSILMSGLGPRLISGGTQKDLDKVFDFTMTFTIPMLFGFMVLSRDILWILRPTYSSGWVAACFLALAGVVGTIGNFGTVSVLGMDKFDQKDELSIREYLTSKIFTLNKLNLAVTALYIASISIYLLIFGRACIVKLVTEIAGVNLLFAIIRAIMNLKLMRRFTELKLNLENIPHYLIASTIMAVAVYACRASFPPLSGSVFKVAPLILALVALGAVVYGVTLYALSQNFRTFVREIRYYLYSLR